MFNAVGREHNDSGRNLFSQCLNTRTVNTLTLVSPFIRDQAHSLNPASTQTFHPLPPSPSQQQLNTIHHNKANTLHHNNCKQLTSPSCLTLFSRPRLIAPPLNLPTPSPSLPPQTPLPLTPSPTQSISAPFSAMPSAPPQHPPTNPSPSAS